jgi:hypothetical protein
VVTRHNLEQWLQDGIGAAKAGQLAEARSILLDVVEQDQTNEAAWYWLYRVFERDEDKRVCLENLLIINPDNQWAQRELLYYIPAPETGPISTELPASPAPARPDREAIAGASLPYALIIKLIAAFWLGISVILLGGGIMAAGEWLVSGIRSRTFPDNITYFQAFELLVAIVLIIFGIIGLNVAVALFIRSVVGFYGSLFLALGLLLVGPTLSLIAIPHSYVTLVCSGGIAGMIFLLTLASQSGFKENRQDDNPSA